MHNSSACVCPAILDTQPDNISTRPPGTARWSGRRPLDCRFRWKASVPCWVWKSRSSKKAKTSSGISALRQKQETVRPFDIIGQMRWRNGRFSKPTTFGMWKRKCPFSRSSPSSRSRSRSGVTTPSTSRAMTGASCSTAPSSPRRFAVTSVSSGRTWSRLAPSPAWITPTVRCSSRHGLPKKAWRQIHSPKPPWRICSKKRTVKWSWRSPCGRSLPRAASRNTRPCRPWWVRMTVPEGLSSFTGPTAPAAMPVGSSRCRTYRRTICRIWISHGHWFAAAIRMPWKCSMTPCRWYCPSLSAPPLCRNPAAVFMWQTSPPSRRGSSHGSLGSIGGRRFLQRAATFTALPLRRCSMSP